MRRSLSVLLTLATVPVLSCSEVPIAPRPGAVFATGRITDRDGPPLAGAYVLFASESADGPYANAYTDSDGRYSIRLSEGVYRVVLGPASPGGYPIIELNGVVVGSSGVTLDYRYDGVRVTGSVVGPSGGVLNAALVGVFRSAGGAYLSASASTVSGRYSPLLPVGTYGFVAYSAAYDQGIPRISSNNVPVLSDTTIDFALTGFTVTASLTLTGPTPIAGATVRAASDGAIAYARTGVDGVATLYLPTGNYTIGATPYPPYVVGPQTITKSIQANQALTFDFSGPRWDMTIRRASDGTAVTGAAVGLDDNIEGTARADTDAFGRCTFLVRPGIAYDLTVGWLDDAVYRTARVLKLSSAADTTFDLSVTPIVP